MIADFDVPPADLNRNCTFMQLPSSCILAAVWQLVAIAQSLGLSPVLRHAELVTGGDDVPTVQKSRHVEGAGHGGAAAAVYRPACGGGSVRLLPNRLPGLISSCVVNHVRGDATP